MANDTPKQRSLPPQPRYYSPFRLHHQGKVNKTVIITILAIALLLILIYLLVGRQFVGQAVSTAFPDAEVIVEAENNGILVKVRGAPDFAVVYFDMALQQKCTAPTDCQPVTCSLFSDPQSQIQSRTGWNDPLTSIQEQGCEDKTDGAHITFGSSTFNVGEDVQSADHDIAFVIPNLQGVKYLRGTLNPFSLYTVEGQNVFGNMCPTDGSTSDVCPFELDFGCNVGETMACGSDIGICQQGTKTCHSDGTFGVCLLADGTAAQQPQREICGDTLDSNCDGNINDNCPIIQQECMTDADCLDGKRCRNGRCAVPEQPAPVSTDGLGGRLRCQSVWECSEWLACSKNNTQSRLCIDTKCARPNTLEVQNCSYSCAESWTCEGWSACSNGKQQRTCDDLHRCGTIARKPPLTQSCAMPAQQLQPQKPQPAAQPAQQAAKPKEKVKPQITQKPQPSLLDLYAIPLLIAAIVIVLTVSAMLLYRLWKKPRMAYNLDELTTWIRDEKAAGASDQEVYDVLREQTGWSEADIKAAFGDESFRYLIKK